MSFHKIHTRNISRVRGHSIPSSFSPVSLHGSSAARGAGWGLAEYRVLLVHFSNTSTTLAEQGLQVYFPTAQHTVRNTIVFPHKSPAFVSCACSLRGGWIRCELTPAFMAEHNIPWWFGSVRRSHTVIWGPLMAAPSLSRNRPAVHPLPFSRVSRSFWPPDRQGGVIKVSICGGPYLHNDYIVIWRYKILGVSKTDKYSSFSPMRECLSFFLDDGTALTVRGW